MKRKKKKRQKKFNFHRNFFRVNWFRKGADGKFAWPGYGQNMRVIEWIVGRVRGTAGGVAGPMGWMPRYADLNWAGLDYGVDRFASIMNIARDGLVAEAAEIKTFFTKFGDRLPAALETERQNLERQAADMPEVWKIS